MGEHQPLYKAVATVVVFLHANNLSYSSIAVMKHHNQDNL